jgi:hypothetical protein
LKTVTPSTCRVEGGQIKGISAGTSSPVDNTVGSVWVDGLTQHVALVKVLPSDFCDIVDVPTKKNAPRGGAFQR